MNREQQLQQLTERLRAACAAEDWQDLADADREVGVGWRRISAQGPWLPAELVALAALQRVHRESLMRCGRELDLARERLQAFGMQKEGWIAYALSDDSEEERA